MSTATRLSSYHHNSSLRRVPDYWCSSKFLWRGGSFTGEVVLCSALVDGGRDHRRYLEPCFIIINQYPTSWAYVRNRQPHQHTHTTHQLPHQLTELIGSTKKTRRGFPNTSPEEQTFLVRVIYTVCCCSASNLAFHAFHPRLLTERLHATHEIFKLFLSKLPLITDPSIVN